MRTKNSQGTLNAYSIQANEVRSGDTFGYKIIAIIWPGNVGWCAFRGLTDWTDDEVREKGDVISYNIAKELFPTIASLAMEYGNF